MGCGNVSLFALKREQELLEQSPSYTVHILLFSDFDGNIIWQLMYDYMTVV